MANKELHSTATTQAAGDSRVACPLTRSLLAHTPRIGCRAAPLVVVSEL